MRRVTSEVPTRQTLKRGIRVSEAVVARMDQGVASRLGDSWEKAGSSAIHARSGASPP